MREIRVRQTELETRKEKEALERADIVAMTTTGAAKYKNLLKLMND